MRILFVCLGNICRSPTAEGVMAKLVADAGLGDEIELDSAGTGAWHVGEPADARARKAALARAIELHSIARQVRAEDFERFDLILAMDSSNQHALRQLAPNEVAREKVRLLREFDPASAAEHDLDVPDPYYDSERGFEIVLDQVQAACEGLLEQTRSDKPR
ncbi:MAG TPA: low molecular weight protein-tyrosine-phosphatase [Solirubrobacteraceae bacterium]|jgi:protein-tyrosine phosphatase|nr:low molecular weight protein-tyrosine-phosphatase [Solirubrobacteraceae bacterium]